VYPYARSQTLPESRNGDGNVIECIAVNSHAPAWGGGNVIRHDSQDHKKSNGRGWSREGVVVIKAPVQIPVFLNNFPVWSPFNSTRLV
jgi:hypothetical protein